MPKTTPTHRSPMLANRHSRLRHQANGAPRPPAAGSVPNTPTVPTTPPERPVESEDHFEKQEPLEPPPPPLSFGQRLRKMAVGAAFGAVSLQAAMLLGVPGLAVPGAIAVVAITAKAAEKNPDLFKDMNAKKLLGAGLMATALVTLAATMGMSSSILGGCLSGWATTALAENCLAGLGAAATMATMLPDAARTVNEFAEEIAQPGALEQFPGDFARVTKTAGRALLWMATGGLFQKDGNS